MADRKEYMKAYYQAHKAEHAEWCRKWRADNPEKVKAINHEQYLKRKEAKRENNLKEKAD